MISLLSALLDYHVFVLVTCDVSSDSSHRHFELLLLCISNINSFSKHFVICVAICDAAGNLHDDDVVDHSDDELWAKEPYRDPRLVVKTAKPFNAEIPPRLQVQHFDTPK